MNIQEEFNFLLRNLSEKEQNNENIIRLRRALTNVINSFITDFDKMSESNPSNKVNLPPIFTMITLYIEQHTELFIQHDSFANDINGISNQNESLSINQRNKMSKRNIEQEFTSFLISRMLRLLANPEIKSLHSHSISLIVSILQTFCLDSPYDFLDIVTEIISALQDLIEFDKDFYDNNRVEPKILNRFLTNSNSFNLEQNKNESALIKRKSIIIESPDTCSFLQKNLVFILNEIGIQFVNVIHEKLYEKLWIILCEQIELGDKPLKTMSYNLILTILDLRVIPLNKFDFSNECLLYFIDCILASCHLTYTANLTESSDNSKSDEIDQNKDFDHTLGLIINKIFRNQSLFEKNIDVNQLLIQMIDIIKVADLNSHSSFLNDSLFVMTYNLLRKKVKSNKYIDSCLQNDIADCLIDYLGKLNHINTYLNFTIAQGLTYEIEVKSKKNAPLNGPLVEKDNDIFKFDMKFDNIQTKLYKKLLNKAKELLHLNKQVHKNSLEFKYTSNGLNSIYEIFSFSCVMCQSDPFVIEEYRNPLIEFSSLIFAQNNVKISQQYLKLTEDSHSIYIQLLLYWTGIVNDTKSASISHLLFSHSLNNLKSMLLSSVYWNSNLTQNIVAYLSLPWLCTENNGHDLVLFKDQGYKQCSQTLVKNTKGSKLVALKKICIELLCLIPNNYVQTWRGHIISQTIRQDPDTELRIWAIKYLPYLMYFVGVSSNALVFQLIPPCLKNERSLDVLKEFSSLLKYICCLISRKCIILRKSTFDKQINLINADIEFKNDSLEIEHAEMGQYFEIVCACCDKKEIDTKIIPKITRGKNMDIFAQLYNRPKYVDTQLIMTFVHYLSNVGLNQQNTNHKDLKTDESQIIAIRSTILENLERTFNHIEFGRLLHQETISQDITDLSKMLQLSKTCTNNSKAANSNHTYLYKEALKLFDDDSLDPIIRFNFSRFVVPKLICFVKGGSIFNQQIASSTNSTPLLPSIQSNEEAFSVAVSASIFNLNEQDDAILEQNFNLESKLCEGFLRAKSSKNKLDLFMYMISLGRFCLSLKKCDEYMFVCIKHLLEIFDSNENDKWTAFMSSLAQRQLFIISKRINMQELFGEFEEKVCEIISDTIYNSIKRHQIAVKLRPGVSTVSYLHEANYSLKDVLRVFNVVDSCSFIKNYQRYLVPYLTFKTTITGVEDHKIITKSLEFLSRKMNSNISKLIEDNFPYIFTYTTLLNTNEIANVFHFITKEICLDIDKLINGNKQRLFNELLSRCGNQKYRQKVWQAVCVLSTSNQEEAANVVTMQLDDKRIVKAIEPGLLAALIHFDMCLMRSHINMKEKCQVLESLNVLIAILGPLVITQVRYKIMTTLKLAMQQCSKYSELNCKLWDTFLRNVDKSALGAILNQVSVNLLRLLDAQPYKISKIFEYLIIRNKDQLEGYFNELYFIPEQSCLKVTNLKLKKYTDVKYLLEKSAGTADSTSPANIKALVGLIKHYLKGSLHENADLRVKALEKLYSLLKEKCSEIIFLIQRQENSNIISEIVLALLHGCRDSDDRAKLLFGSCLGEIGAIDPANVQFTAESIAPIDEVALNPNSSRQSISDKSSSSQKNGKIPSFVKSNDLITLVNENSVEFSENFAHSLIIELSKAYLAARTTHEQDSASYAIQECLKIYGCSTTGASSSKISNQGLWNSFPDYFKEILIPLRTSKYEIQSFNNLGAMKTPIILNECKNYEEWIYKWCAYLISKISTDSSAPTNKKSNVVDLTEPEKISPANDKELKVFPKLQFIIRFNVNVALFILPYLIIKMIIQNVCPKIIDQIFEEIISVIQLNQLIGNSKVLTPNTNSSIISNPANTPNSSPKILEYQHICCQTVFNIYDHLMRQLNYYREKMNELQTSISQNKRSGQTYNHRQDESQLSKYKLLYESFNKFIQRMPQQTISKAAYEYKAYCRSLMHYELHMRNTPGAIMIRGNSINIDAGMLIELQSLYASMDEIDAASGILLLKKGSEESLADAAFRHKINGRLNESIACIEQMLESNESAKYDIKQHETYIRTFINVGRHRNALSYLEGLMNDRNEWKDALDSYRVEACWKLGSWNKLKQVCNANKSSFKSTGTQNDLNEIGSNGSKQAVAVNSLQGADLFNIFERGNTVNSFNAGIGKLFVLVDEHKEDEFNLTLNMLREQQIGPLSAVSMEAGGNSYQRGYEYVVNLHALQEIETCMEQLLRLRDGTPDKEHYRNTLIKNFDTYLTVPWEHRVQSMQPSFKHLEPIFNVRIGLLQFLSSYLDINVSKPVAKLWLNLAKIARKAGMFENAYQYMLNAQGQIKPSDSNYLEELLVEKSKWYWQREDQDSALFYLQKGLNELFNNDSTSVKDSTNSELYSKVLLMYTKFSEENGSLDSDTIRQNYLKVQKICSKSEQAHFQLAQFTDRLGTSISENTGKKEKFYEYISDVITYYSYSLEYGCQYIYQSLPRMIALWLDFGADYFDHATSASSSSKKNDSLISRNLMQLNSILVKLNQTISSALQRIPTYAFLTVYPQMVSRICHPEERVFETLSNILMKVLFLYPSQAIWMLIAVKNSSVELRKNRCKKIMDKAIRQQPDLKKFISDSSELAEKLVDLGNFNVESSKTELNMSVHFKALKRLVESKGYSRIIIPSQFQVTLQLPTNESNNNTSTSGNGNGSGMLGVQKQNFRTHNPYPLELVYINCFEEKVNVMNSLQKPKKVTIRGTDGKLYAFLSKAKDDLRIDYRIMEFFSVVNKCLKQEPESRRRNLYIRTYAVTPLNENSGIIEWIENLSTLRSILLKLYAERGIGSVTSTEWRQHESKIRNDKEYQLKVFKIFLDKYRPTVLYEWFLRTFQEPNSWYNARSNFVRTAAVMSVCGYVLGLGDRHCENILMASSNGDCIHVDFNCLFNKGETLAIPEIVPFRLTHNMTEAMGPLGYEGIYRKTCECSLKILRDYKEPLITILKTFIYDPLVEWKTSNYKNSGTGETISAKGQIHLQNITCRLRGMHTKMWTNSKVKALPLSVEGHVNTLIKDATDDKNLAAMYIGWSAFF